MTHFALDQTVDAMKLVVAPALTADQIETFVAAEAEQNVDVAEVVDEAEMVIADSETTSFGADCDAEAIVLVVVDVEEIVAAAD